MTESVTPTDLHDALTDLHRVVRRLSRTLDTALRTQEVPDPGSCWVLLRWADTTLDHTSWVADQWEEQEDQWLRDLAREHETPPSLPASTDIALEAIVALNRPDPARSSDVA